MRRQQRAFTLVELLVAVGILAVLASILLPAVNHVREQARQATCASNMRQLCFAASEYAAANDGWLPLPCLVGETFNAATLPVTFSSPGVGVLDLNTGSLVPYLSGSEVARRAILNCPSDLDEARIVRKGSVQVLPRNFSYSFNVELRAKTTWPSGHNFGNWTCIRLSDIRNPAHKVMVVEENWPNDQCAYIMNKSGNGTGDADDIPASRHLGLSNMGFADGSVHAMWPADLGFDPNTAQVTNASRNNSYCNLFKP